MKIINADAFMAEINSAIDNMTKIGIAVDGEWLWEKLNDALDNAPPIEPEPHWIPCKDRLPEQEQRVLINLSDGDTSVGWLLRGNIWFTDYSYGKPEDEVIAWMPLPECYRGENDG